MATTIFAIDLGTQSLRLSAYVPGGEQIWGWSSPVTSAVVGTSYTQQSVEWADLLHQAFHAASKEGVQPSIIAASGPLAGWVPLDSDGHALAPAVMYLDGRAQADIETVRNAINSSTTVRPSFRTTVADPLPNALRLRRETPEIASRTQTMLDATGSLNFFLTGERTLNTYTALRLYSDAIRNALHIPPNLFGRVVPVGEEIGKLNSDLATTYGFNQVPVISASFDSKCAYISAGLSQQGDALDISGTVTSVGVYHPTEIRDEQQRIYSVPFQQGSLVRGSNACSGSTIAWAEKHLLHSSVDLWSQSAATVSPGANGVTFLPYLAGERTPYWTPHARGALLGLGLDTTSAVIARAVLESLAYSLRHILDCMKDCGVNATSLRISGGLAQNDLLSQIKADVTGLPVHRLVNKELTSLGLVAICAVALGLEADLISAAGKLATIEKTFLPTPATKEDYEIAYQRYRGYAEALLPVFQRAAIS
ncbi:MAG: hypothetical protein JSS87_07495 [Acidobacteria bacterium]|nr:hypothetical protein [Acidobacteriota bacterium]